LSPQPVVLEHVPQVPPHPSSPHVLPSHCGEHASAAASGCVTSGGTLASTPPSSTAVEDQHPTHTTTAAKTRARIDRDYQPIGAAVLPTHQLEGRHPTSIVCDSMTDEMSLQSTIDALAKDFAAKVIHALRRASLDDVSRAPRQAAGPSKPAAAKKRIRRSPAELQRLADHLVAIVMKHPNGIRAEDLKRAFGVKPGNVGAKVFTRPLAVALQAKKIAKRGQRRKTTYHAR
jgi:hypothetical protein